MSVLSGVYEISYGVSGDLPSTAAEIASALNIPLSSVKPGLPLFCVDTGALYVWNGSATVQIGGGGGSSPVSKAVVTYTAAEFASLNDGVFLQVLPAPPSGQAYLIFQASYEFVYDGGNFVDNSALFDFCYGTSALGIGATFQGVGWYDQTTSMVSTVICSGVAYASTPTTLQQAINFFLNGGNFSGTGGNSTAKITILYTTISL